MKASVYITGDSSSRLRAYIISADLHVVTVGRSFGAYEVLFRTKGDARRALRHACRLLKQDNRGSGLLPRLTGDGQLFYDASKAVLWPRPEWRGVGSNS
jgi:hypothetical protein